MTSCMVCNMACKTVAGATSFCGDGMVDATNAEICDDRNATCGTCNNTCKVFSSAEGDRLDGRAQGARTSTRPTTRSR